MRSWNFFSNICQCACFHENIEDELEMKQLDNIVKDIITVGKFFSENGKSIKECRKYIFDNFNIKNIDFYDCRMIDEYTYGKGGLYRVDVYGYPNEDDLITDEDSNFFGIAHNVGIFTFDIICQYHI